MSEKDPDQEGRKKRETWKRASKRARDAVRYAVIGAGFSANLAELIGFVGRHL